MSDGLTTAALHASTAGLVASHRWGLGVVARHPAATVVAGRTSVVPCAAGAAGQGTRMVWHSQALTLTEPGFSA